MAGQQRAYLWVTSDVGPNSTLEEFHDWYDNEHVPIRMQAALPEFLTGARYQAADGKHPGWSAIYEVSDPAFFGQHKYTRLRANRSPREANLIGRLSILDRRTYTSLVGDSAGSSPPRGADKAAPFTVTIAGNEEPGSMEALKGVKGWTRTHAYKLGDSLITGEGRDPLPNSAPAYATVHEFSTDEFERDEGYQKALPKGAEIRVWRLYRAWDNTASKA